LLVAAVIGNLLTPPLEAFAQSYRPTSWAAILFIGVFGTLLPFGLYNEGIKLLRPAHASITATLEPVIAGVISYFFLGEVLGPLQVGGAGLVILSILLLQMKRAKAGIKAA
jgi:drug/metabolite transporter (DMT)-like permease